MATKAAYVSGFERGAITDEVIGNIGAQTSRNTTSPITGSVDVKMAYPSGSTTWSTMFSITARNVEGTGATYRKMSLFFRMKFSALPTAAATLLTIPGTGGKLLQISTAGKIVLDATTGTFVMSTATVYEVELIIDRDWTSLNIGSMLCKISDNTHAQQDSISEAINPTSLSSVLSFGETIGKVATGPNTNIQIDDIVALFSDSTLKKAPWIGQQTIQTTKVPTANGNYNDFTGVGDATNKYANEDENPSNGNTDFNSGGAFGVIKRNTTTTWGLSAGTYTYWSVFQVWTASPGQNLTGDFQTLVRDNSVDYTASISSPTPTVYSTNVIGSDTLPDLTALAGNTTRLSALETGFFTNLTYTSYNTGYQSAETKPTSDGATYGTNWATTGANRWSVIDDGLTENAADYISTGTLNLVQGLGLTWSITPLTAIGDVVFKIHIRCASRWDVNQVGGSGGFCTPGVRIGGVDYLCDAGSVFLMTPSLTTSGLSNQALAWSASNNNPATGNRWTKADIDGAEWLLKITTLGSGIGGTNTGIVTNLYLDIYTASTAMVTTQFLNTAQGDAQTDNGNVAGIGSHLLASTGVGS